MSRLENFREAISHALDEPLAQWAEKGKQGRRRMAQELIEQAIARDRLLAEVGKIEAESEDSANDESRD